jgi:hypothetical protein
MQRVEPGDYVQVGQNLLAGSGAAFSLLPAENATGNYVKVVQRIPVKIRFNSIPDVGLPLGPGESILPTVKVQDFHYSAAQLMIVAARIGGAILGVLWLGDQAAQSQEGRLREWPTEYRRSSRENLLLIPG